MTNCLICNDDDDIVLSCTHIDYICDVCYSNLYSDWE